MAAVADFPSPTGTYDSATTPSGDAPAPSRTHAHSSLAQRWFSLRWQLSRAVFAKPLPFLTEALELKLGDLLVTLPVAAAVIVINAIRCSQQDVGGSGGLAALMMIPPFALAVRNNSILLILTGLPYERALFYHKFFGGVAWIVGGLHGLAYLLEQDDSGSRRRLQYRGDRGSGTGPDGESETISRELSGALTFYFFSALVFFSFYKIRRRFFELFLRAHWIFFILIVVFGVIHGAGLMLFGFIPWAIDMVFRFGYKAPSYARRIQASQVTVAHVSKDIVRVQFPRDATKFQYEAGQYVFLCFPQVAKLEWHPFTIASAPHEPMVTIYIKVLGDWTRKLSTHVAKAGGTVDAPKNMTMLVDGPYGAVSIEMERYSHVLFVSGGIGITPMMSLANDLYHNRAKRATPIQKAWFMWSVRDREIIQAMCLRDATKTLPASDQSWLPHVLGSSSTANSKAHDAFFAQFFLTRGTQDLSNPVDQQLALSLQYNQRPQIAAILQELGQLAASHQGWQAKSKHPARVGVLVCGPQAMISEVVRQSMSVSKELKDLVIFDVHQETFDF